MLLRLLALLAAIVAVAPLARATPSFDSSTAWNTVATYQSIGLYWKPTSVSGGKATVRFRPQGAGTWREGHELWWDSRNGEFRGSLVELDDGTPYEIQLKVGTGAWNDTTTSCDTGSAECALPVTTSCNSTNRNQCTKTWSNSYPVKEVRNVTSRTTKLIITEGGNETEGYIVYQGVDGNNTITLSESTDDCVLIDAKFVVLRNLVIQGCREHGIVLHSVHQVTQSSGPRRAASDIIIEDNEITNWGRIRTTGMNPPLAHDGDAALFCNNGAETANGDDDAGNRTHRIVVQRNLIHTPRYGSEPWIQGEGSSQTHPHGAVAMSFISCGWNHVVRWNEVYSTPDAQGQIKHFKDAFGGSPDLHVSGEDMGAGGFPWADSDLYGNAITQTYDDGIESEGDNRNVRIWANYFDHVFMAVGSAATAKGPLYVWRNVTNWMADMGCPTCDTDTTLNRGIGLIKGGAATDAYMGGISYYYHNTLLQPPPPPGKTRTMGAARPLESIGDGRFHNFVSRNNILQNHRIDNFRTIAANCSTTYPCTPPTPDNGPGADYDLFNGRLLNAGPNAEANAMALGWGNGSSGNANAIPTYSGGSNYPSAIPTDANDWTGDFRLAASSLGTTNVPLLPNFNDQDSARHVGAQPPNKTQMKFGRSASTGGGGIPGGGSAPTFRAASSASLGSSSAITFRAAASAATNTSSLSIAIPSSTVANDVMIASIGVRPVAASITPPAGWTLVRRVDNGTNISLAVFRKVATSSEPSSYTWSASGATFAVGGIQSFANVDTANPIDVEAGQATPTALTHTAPSVTTTVANTMVVTSHTFATSTTWNPPSGMTEGFDAQFQPIGANMGQSTEGNYVLQAAAGSTGAKTATADGGAGAEGSGATHTLALRPAPPGLNVATPSGTTANDVMIAAIGVRPATVAITPPSGWTLVRRVDNGTNISLAVYRKVAGASEPASHAWGVSGATYAVAGIQSFAGVDTTNPIDVENGQATATSLTHATPSVTTTTANTMLVTAHTFATSTTWNPPTGMTEGYDVQVQPVAAGLGQSVEGNYAVQAAAGASGAKTATANGGAGDEGAGATHIMALRPAQ